MKVRIPMINVSVEAPKILGKIVPELTVGQPLLKQELRMSNANVLVSFLEVTHPFAKLVASQQIEIKSKYLLS